MTNDEKKELLCALVDGKTLQYSDDGLEWHDCEAKSGWVAREVLEEVRDFYRIKPETVVNYLVPEERFGERYWSDYEVKQLNAKDKPITPQIKLTWEDDKLISAEVVK